MDELTLFYNSWIEKNGKWWILRNHDMMRRLTVHYSGLFLDSYKVSNDDVDYVKKYMWREIWEKIITEWAQEQEDAQL